MPVRCAKCGEELLGAVNRCWQCGSPVTSHSESGSDPPIRRSPPEPLPPVTQAVVVQPTASPPASSAGVGDVRVGSPFAPAAALHRAAAPPVHRPEARMARAQAAACKRPAAARGGAIAAPIIGGLALIVLRFPVASLVLAGLGLVAGVWGLYSDRRAVAVAGIFLCCTALAIAGFSGIAGLYEQLYGVNPWDELRDGLQVPLD